MRRINASYFEKSMAIMKIGSPVNDEGLEETDGAGEVRVVRNCYESDSIDVPVDDAEFGNDGSDDGQRYDDPAASGEYDPGLSVEGVFSDLGDLEARTGRMELDSRPPERIVDGIADDVGGNLVIAGNDTGGQVVEVMGHVDERSALDEVMENPNANKVLSVRNAAGDEFAVVLVDCNVGTQVPGAVVYERAVFFCGKEVPMDPQGKPDFSSFDSGKIDEILLKGIFESFGRDLFDVDLRALNINTEMWLGGLKQIGRYEEVKRRGKMEIEFVVDSEIDDLFENLRVDFSELGRIKSLVGVGEFFSKMMPNTPMHNMITHMIQGPCRAMEAAIDAYLMDAVNANDVLIGLEMLHSNGQRLAVITEEFLPLIVKHGVHPHPVNLREIAEKVKRCVGDDQQRAKVEVDVDPNVVGFFSEAFLLPIIENAVINAIKFGGRVRITVEEDDGAVVFRVHDDAPDMPESTLENLFLRAVDPAQPVVPGVQKGSGTGSFIAGKIMTDMKASGIPGADKFNIRFVQEQSTEQSPRKKCLELTMPSYGYSQAAYSYGLNRRANNGQVNVEAAA